MSNTRALIFVFLLQVLPGPSLAIADEIRIQEFDPSTKKINDIAPPAVAPQGATVAPGAAPGRALPLPNGTSGKAIVVDEHFSNHSILQNINDVADARLKLIAKSRASDAAVVGGTKVFVVPEERQYGSGYVNTIPVADWVLRGDLSTRKSERPGLPQTVIDVGNQSFLMAGYSLSSDGRTSYARLSLINRSGESIKDKFFARGANGTARFQKALLRPAQSEVLIAGSGSSQDGSVHAWLVSFDLSTLVPKWERLFLVGDESHAESIVSLGGGNIAIVGWTKDPGEKESNLLVAKLNSEGGLIWLRSCGGVKEDIGFDLDRMEDDGLLVVGVTRSKDKNFRKPWVLRLDADGYVLWERGLFLAEGFSYDLRHIRVTSSTLAVALDAGWKPIQILFEKSGRLSGGPYWEGNQSWTSSAPKKGPFGGGKPGLDDIGDPALTCVDLAESGKDSRAASVNNFRDIWSAVKDRR